MSRRERWPIRHRKLGDAVARPLLALLIAVAFTSHMAAMGAHSVMGLGFDGPGSHAHHTSNQPSPSAPGAGGHAGHHGPSHSGHEGPAPDRPDGIPAGACPICSAVQAAFWVPETRVEAPPETSGHIAFHVPVSREPKPQPFWSYPHGRAPPAGA